MNIKNQTLTIELTKDDSTMLTSAISCLIDWKKDNVCKKEDCVDCQNSGDKIREHDIEKLVKDIASLYYDMYVISMSTTRIPSLDEIRKSIK